jgi:repressor LexA
MPMTRRFFDEIRKLDFMARRSAAAKEFSFFTKLTEKIRYIEHMENVWKDSTMTKPTLPSLTLKQQKVYEFLQAYMKKNERAPTLNEIAKHFEFKSVGTVQDYISALEKKGVISRESRSWGGIELIESGVPLLGRVAAGRPIEHLKVGENIDVPQRMLKAGGKHFALEVVGDSMVNEGILEGDIVVIRQKDSADNGQIVVAMIDNEATIKRFYKKRGGVELHSANEKYAPIVVKSNQNFHIEGIFCGLIRF